MVNFKKYEWGVILYLITIYVGALFSIFYINFNWDIILFLLFSYMLSTYSFSIGWHRYYAHKSFELAEPLKWIFVMVGTSIGLGSLKKWISEHRAHHSYTDKTGKDPHSISKGFFYSYMGWLFYEKKYEYKGQMSKLIEFQDKYVLLLTLVTALIIPGLFYYYIIENNLLNSFLVAFCLRSAISQQVLLLLTSAAHTFGEKDPDEKESATNSHLLALLIGGEGYHLNHHKYPQAYDFTVGKLGLDTSAILIRFLKKLGLVKKLKSKKIN